MATVKNPHLIPSSNDRWNADLLNPEYGFELPSGTKEPELNVKENNKFYEVEIGVPGLGNKDFHIRIENGTLTISAEKNPEEHADDYGILKLSIAKPAEEVVED